jgi:serine/threonine-protein kinase
MTERRLVANRFQMDTLVGQGGMGEVYQGVDTQTGETVAVKLLKVTDNPALLERFVREAGALRRLNHPNIVKVLAFV